MKKYYVSLIRKDEQKLFRCGVEERVLQVERRIGVKILRYEKFWQIEVIEKKIDMFVVY